MFHNQTLRPNQTLHAVIAVSFALIALWQRNAAWVAISGIPSLLLFAIPLRQFSSLRNLANTVTMLRLLAVGWIAFVGQELPAWQVATLALAMWALDGLDGYVARKLDQTSQLGAAFDMETDALWLLVLVVMIWLHHRIAPWVVGIGLIRYLYVLTLALVPPRYANGPEPRNPFARLIAGLTMVGLALAFVLPTPYVTLAITLLTALMMYSFTRSFVWSYRRPPQRAIE